MVNESSESTSQENQQLRATPKETFYPTSGVHRYEFSDGTKITGISANTWEGFLEYFSSTTPDDRIIVSPESITFTDQPFSDVEKAKDEIEEKIDQVKKLSIENLGSLIIVGTPTFPAMGKSRNSALGIKNGEVVMTTNKRSGATVEENSYFDLVVEEPPATIPGTDTALLICSDLPVLTLYTRELSVDIDRILSMSGKNNLIGKNPTFINIDQKNLVLMSCWGVGSGLILPQERKDEYYAQQLRNTASWTMRSTNITQIAVVDCIPDSNETDRKPHNAFFEKAQ